MHTSPVVLVHTTYWVHALTVAHMMVIDQRMWDRFYHKVPINLVNPNWFRNQTTFFLCINMQLNVEQIKIRKVSAQTQVSQLWAYSLHRLVISVPDPLDFWHMIYWILTCKRTIRVHVVTCYVGTGHYLWLGAESKVGGMDKFLSCICRKWA